MTRFVFYLRYAVRSFTRSGARAVFATFCVAAGVAAVVALQMVGANLHDSITGNAQRANRGDVSVTAPSRGMPVADYARFDALKRAHVFTDYTPLVDSMFTIRVVGGDPTQVELGGVNGIDPAKYPFYDQITADQPSGVPLSQLLANRRNIVVNHAVFDKLRLHLGDKVQITIRAHSHNYTVTGVVPNTAVTVINNMFSLNAFALVDYRTIQKDLIAEGSAAARVYITTRDAAQATLVKQKLTGQLNSLYSIQTAADVEKSNSDAAAVMNKFLTVMGLLALLIGGIGIVNTMLVAARRRRKEIAIVKALGMKQSQVVATFTMGAILLGVTGGALGILAGIGASRIVHSVVQNLMPTTRLEWHVQPMPILAGIVVAIVGTVLFAFIPVFRETQIRPIAALREDNGAHRGFLQRTVSALGNAGMALALAAVMGILAAFFVGFGSPATNIVLGAIVGIVGLLILGLLVELFSWTILGISKLPVGRMFTMRLALRGLGRQRHRMASTLLALCIGILSVGSVAILAQNIKSQLGTALGRENSFNGVVFYGLASHDMARVRASVNALPGVTSHEFAGVNGRAKLVTVDTMSADTIIAAELRKPGNHDAVKAWSALMLGIAGRDLRQGALTTSIDQGRVLGPQDVGTNHAIIEGNLAQMLSIHPGSIVGYRVAGRIVDFTVVGVIPVNSMTMRVTGLTVDNSYLQSVGGLNPGDNENYSTTYLKINSANLNGDIAALNRDLPRATVLDLSVVASFINTWIDKFAMFPEVLAALSLFAGVVIIANAVAMTMMERRREIAIMKAVGARRNFVLRELLAESGIIGFLGALFGTLLAMAATASVDQQFLKINAGFDPVAIAGLLALGVVLAVGAALITAWPTSGEKPLRVLRYE